MKIIGMKLTIDKKEYGLIMDHVENKNSTLLYQDIEEAHWAELKNRRRKKIIRKRADRFDVREKRIRKPRKKDIRYYDESEYWE